MLGDAQYEYGYLDKFAASYDPTWGQFLDKTWATAGGSHDFYGGGDFYEYFGTRAGPAPYSGYSFDIGAWHVVSMPSYCNEAEVGGCGPGSQWYDWLENDLASNPGQCSIVFWHKPRWSSGTRHGNDSTLDPFVRLLYQNGVDLLLTGHEHSYERFAPQDPDSNYDPVHGIQEFVVGTGGKYLYSDYVPEPNSEVFQGTDFGVLKLTLHSNSYDWEFVPDTGSGNFTDSGSEACR